MAKPKSEPKPEYRHHLDRRANRLADEGEKGNNPDQLLTAQQVADWLGITEQWVKKGLPNGYGPQVTKPFPEVTRFKRRDVVRWLRGRARLHASTVREDA